jgi:uncharacterized protein YeaO (DUF488 family)
MSIRIVQLGTGRADGEGLRIGTVRRPPRGVPKAEFSARNYYDVWLPILSPSAELMTQGRNAADDAEWSAFERKFRQEMNAGDASKVLDLLAALSATSNFSIGCYCDDERRCHRGILRRLLSDSGASIV